MKTEFAQTLAFVHGVVAWSATVLLLLLGFVLVRRRLRRTRAHASLLALTTSLLIATGVSGALLELPYRYSLRQHVFLASRALGFAFERKLHFALGALVFAAIALTTLFAERMSAEEKTRAELMRVTTLGFVVSAVFAFAAALASSIVASRLRF